MIKKILLFLLFIFAWACIVWVSLSLAYTPISRQRNFVNDAANSIPITASYMDGEFNQLVNALNGTLIVQGSAPSSPFEGEFWYDTTNHVLKFYRNNEWILVNPIHSGSVMATPQNNDLWINSVAGQNHLKIYGVNWSDIPAVPGLNGVNWQLPVFNGTNWQKLTVSKGANWNTANPILFNGVNWDDPSYSPGGNKVWQYQSFGNTPLWTTQNSWVPTNIQVFTSTGTWTKPSNVSQVYVKVIGGGGAGGTSGTGTTNVGGGGGGCGGYAEGIIGVTGNVTVTVGATTSFAGTTTIQATSGSAGATTRGIGGTGGVGSNGTINLTGGPGESAALIQAGGSAFSRSGAGCSGPFGAGGLAVSNAGAGCGGGTVGNNGTGYGAGGSGGDDCAAAGGSGSSGAVIVYY